MRKLARLLICLCLAGALVVSGSAYAQDQAAPEKAKKTKRVKKARGKKAQAQAPAQDEKGWTPLFAADLSDAINTKGVWSVTDGVLTASADECIWTTKDYENFVIDLEFKNAAGTNSGVVVYASDMKNWIPNSVEIQIADDFAKEWSEKPATWHCAAIFGRMAPTKSVVKKAGEWNHMTLTCKGQQINVTLNGEEVTKCDMKLWTSAKKNPDGSEIPAWLSKPMAELATKGRIGLQGKHAGAPIFFRNVRIKAAE